MTKLMRVFSLVLILCIMLAATAVPAFAQTMPTESSIEPSREESVYQIEASDKDMATEEPDIPADDGQKQVDVEQSEIAPEPEEQKDPNTPIYVGAGIAIALLISVFIFCKLKGNR
jgi:hypothetical protein